MHCLLLLLLSKRPLNLNLMTFAFAIPHVRAQLGAQHESTTLQRKMATIQKSLSMQALLRGDEIKVNYSRFWFWALDFCRKHSSGSEISVQSTHHILNVYKFKLFNRTLWSMYSTLQEVLQPRFKFWIFVINREIGIIVQNSHML
jgi:hypothetical protein